MRCRYTYEEQARAVSAMFPDIAFDDWNDELLGTRLQAE